MHDDWRMRECINQMLLYVAFRARDAILKRPADDLPIAEPLPPITGLVKTEAQAMCDDLERDPSNVEPIQVLMNKVRATARNTKIAAKIENTPAWTIGALVEWWIRAGAAIADWRPSAYGAVSSPDQPESRFLARALTDLVLEDDEEWPPIWCAAHSRSWKLPGHLPADRPAAWDRPGKRDDYRRHLLDWCGDPRREGIPSPEPLDETEAKRWVRDYQTRYRDFARVAVRLVRAGCQFGQVRDASVSGSGWNTYRESRLPAGMFEVLRRPLYQRSNPDGPPIAVGWLIVPSPLALIAELRNTTIAAGSPTGTVARALDRAAAAWTACDRAFGPLEAATSTEGDATVLAHRLASVAWLMTAVDASSAFDHKSHDALDVLPRDPLARLRLALTLEGITTAREPRAGSDSGRVIPLDRAVARPGHEAAAPLVLTWGGERVELGVLAEPSRCPESLFAAIEEVDWCQWALRICNSSQAVKLVAVDWEPCKRRLLMAGPEAPETGDTLAKAFELLHPVLLSIAPLRANRSDAAWLGDTLAGLERAICSLLVTTDSDVASTLHPPRTSDARVSLMAWLDAPPADDPRAARWRVAWEPASSPFGTVLREESSSEDGFRVVVSAGEIASDADRWLFSAPGVIHRPVGPWNLIAEPITACLRAAVREGTTPDTSAVIGEIKAALGDVQAHAFDDLVHRAIDGDARAIEWIRLMLADPRFEFECHPTIDVHEHGVSRRDVRIGDGWLEWREADEHVDEEIEVRFATDASRAQCVLSRGRPAAASAEAIAARLVHAVRTGPGELATAARRIQRATDLRRKFGESAAEPIAAALAAGDALVAAGETFGDAASRAFDELSAWCQTNGFKLIPERWHPAHGVAADGLDVVGVDFHPTVPAGNVVVKRFGIRCADPPVALEALVSAGPPPEGFLDVMKVAQQVAGDRPEITRFRHFVAEFAGRTLKGQGSSAAASLFDVTWRAAMAAPRDAVLEAAAEAVRQFLEKSYHLITFEPTSLTQYPDAWLRNRENGPARGLRVERVVRPGLRKRDSDSPIYPAIVETG
jgi:hypothetical protein